MDISLKLGASLALALPLMGCLSSPSASPGVSLEESLIFHPQRYPDGQWEPAGFSFEDAWFQAPDGVRLHGWFAEAEQPRAVVLYAHGNAGNVTSRRWVLQLYRDRLHASILVFDYRGYGRSEGSPSEVVLENTFTSLPDVAASHAGLLPLHWLMRTRLDSLAKIRHYHGPLLQAHGDADRVIPFNLGKRLFEAANEPKEFVRIAGADHNDPPPPVYLLALQRFLHSLPATGQAAIESR